jgi:tRNA (guanosine-2'-O-)-methyltransferase
VSRVVHLSKSGVLPERYLNTEWVAPGRSDENAALALASPAQVVEALAPGIGDARRARLDQVASSRLAGVAVVLEDLHDPHNGGAALRSCEAMGLHQVHVVANQERFRTSPKITQGCDKWLEVVEHRDTMSCLDGLRQRGFRLYAAVPGARLTLEELPPLPPAAFLIGNEHAGLSKAARAQCDVEFTIPLYGFSESVNLSVATALIVYTHCTRRRQALQRPGDLSDDEVTELRARYYARDVRSAPAQVRRFIDAAPRQSS